MNRIYVTLGLLAIACSGLQAQAANMQANIPFDFQIGKNHMPAGDYKLQYAAHSQVLTLFETHTRRAAIVLTIPVSRSDTPDNGVLKFNRYGDEYFFAGVWKPGSFDGSTVARSSREKELANRTRLPESTAIAVRK